MSNGEIVTGRTCIKRNVYERRQNVAEINYSDLFVKAFDDFEEKFKKEREEKTTRSPQRDWLPKPTHALKYPKSDAEG